ncbi:carbon starvation protein A [Sporomusa sp. KB1]|jgi:carbon starvation protein|uniref:carbon starvation CstA family protein n=1 Tax=Sporomusa sp. KB1 TaxID=943346 RepID=UPI0011A2D252|nr:carbon starvation protein A [Sporomusa sp. KB1]TWH51631.1 carbon starvation protein [Sporomusa sp. KB1]TWH52210.1 carbon starvation protein [Sporomusa sp. KB1]
MTGLTLLGIALLVCASGYFIYGRWLTKVWGIDPDAKTPAYRLEDGNDYVPSSKFTVFAHQFSSITGAGPVTGPIIAAMFGWLPVMLWLMIGGIFFGAVQDFTALYASVKNEGKSMGMLIEKYIGKTGKQMFLLFSWLFTLLVTAAFADIVASTFNGFSPNGSLATPNAAAASISMLYIVVAIFFGLFLEKFPLSEKPKLAVGILLIIGMLAAGIAYPLYFDKTTWIYVVFAYMFMAAVMPMWLLMEPRDYLSSFLLLGMIASGVIGVVFTNPTIELPAFVGFEVNGKPMFPILFITIACGAVSGFHSLVSSGTSSKTISNEKDMLFVGYGSMMVETILAVVALIVVGAAATGGVMPKGTPFQIFSASVGNFLSMFGMSSFVATCVVTMCVSALALTTLDSVGRIGRMCFQELFTGDTTDPAKMSPMQRVLTNKYVATVITLFSGYLLCLGGYMNVWPLFGAANQLCAALVLIALAVFMKVTGRQGKMLYIPMCFMLVVTLISLGMSIYGIVHKIIYTGGFSFLTDGLQLIVAIALITLAMLIASTSFRKLVDSSANNVSVR